MTRTFCRILFFAKQTSFSKANFDSNVIRIYFECGKSFNQTVRTYHTKKGLKQHTFDHAKVRRIIQKFNKGQFNLHRKEFLIVFALEILKFIYIILFFTLSASEKPTKFINLCMVKKAKIKEFLEPILDRITFEILKNKYLRVP